MVIETDNKTKREIKADLKKKRIEEKRERRQKMLEERQARKQKKPVDNALIIDPHDGFYLMHIDEPIGRQWRYENLWVYLLLRKTETKDGAVIETLTPIKLPEKLGQLPDKLYRALFWKEGEILFSLRNTLLEKLNTLSTYVLIGLLLFFIYLMYNSL